jgi:hypothetical protein
MACSLSCRGLDQQHTPKRAPGRSGSPAFFLKSVPGRAPKWSGVPQQPDAQNVESSSHPKTLSHLFWFDDEQWAKITPVVRRQLLTHPIGARVGR